MKRTLTLAVLTIFCTAQVHAADSPKPPATSPAAPRVQELRIADTVVFFNLVRIPAGTVTLSRCFTKAGILPFAATVCNCSSVHAPSAADSGANAFAHLHLPRLAQATTSHEYCVVSWTLPRAPA